MSSIHGRRANNRAKATVRFEEPDVVVKQENPAGQFNGLKLESQSSQAQPCYVVAHGLRPGIYNDEDEAKKAVNKFQGQRYNRFDNRKDAILDLQRKGFGDADIHLFRSTFISAPGYTHNPSTPFNREFNRFASSQPLLSDDERRKARTDGMMHELIRLYLPQGVRLKSDWDHDDDGNADLDDDETLEIYQHMCQVARKKVGQSINDCLYTLKDSPFVNILDFIDTYRTGRPLRTFKVWDEFVDYTEDGHRIDVKLAKSIEFLAPLLQHLTYGPGAVDPVEVRETFVAKRNARRRKQEAERAALSPEHSPVRVSMELSRDLSPSVFDRESDRSSSPAPATPILAASDLPDYSSQNIQVKLESAVTSSIIATKQLSSPPMTPSDISDSDLIELSMRIEATQDLQPLKRRMKSPSLASDISDSDMIELSMRFEATQDAEVKAHESQVASVSADHTIKSLRERSHVSEPLRRSKRQRK